MNGLPSNELSALAPRALPCLRPTPHGGTPTIGRSPHAPVPRPSMPLTSLLNPSNLRPADRARRVFPRPVRPQSVPVVQRPRTPPFQGENTGSNPVGDAKSSLVAFSSSNTLKNEIYDSVPNPSDEKVMPFSKKGLLKTTFALAGAPHPEFCWLCNQIASKPLDRVDVILLSLCIAQGSTDGLDFCGQSN